MEFMDGVNLVETVTIRSAMADVLVFIVSVITVAVSITGLYVILIDKPSSRTVMKIGVRSIVGCFMSLVGMVLLICGVGVCDKLFGSVQGYWVDTGEYRVTIAETADMNELFTRYDVVEFKDGVFTVRFRQNE